MKPYEMPPVLTGTAEERLEQLRQYLQRLIIQLNEEGKT